MFDHYGIILKAAEREYEDCVSRLCADGRNLYENAVETAAYITDPRYDTTFINLCCALYGCAESVYYRSGELLSRIVSSCEMLQRIAHRDGTVDSLVTNFYMPPSFELQDICRAYDNLQKYSNGAPAENKALASVESTVSLFAQGCLNGGFHTPNHRWVECAALLMSYKILKLPPLLEKAERYLSEGIDCDEYGEFTERSVGCYNATNVNSLMVMAEAGGYDGLYAHVRKNLDLTFDYLDADGTLFTKNSRRQDRDDDAFYPAHCWYFLYLWAGWLFKNDRYLKFAYMMFSDSVSRGLGAPSALWLYQRMPELKTLDLSKIDLRIPDTYHAYYPNSNIVRVRKRDFSYTLMANNPDFMFVKFGRSLLSVRMCASFFAVAQFKPQKLMKTENGYRMEFTGHGEYRGLLPSPTVSPDWYQMDHASRSVVHPCDLDFSVDFADISDGVKLKIHVSNTPRVPFKLEIIIPAGSRVEGDSFVFDAPRDGDISVKTGDIRIEEVETGCAATVSGLFYEHMYHRQMRGSLPPLKGAFCIYATGFTPIEREIVFRFSKRGRARIADEKI